MVTCQTLLIHVADPAAVLAEMLRVLKPGGVVVAAEPNNRAGLHVDIDLDASIDEIAGMVRFYLTCERGKIAPGEGNDSVGDLLPGILARLGATHIETFISDKASRLTPPYDGDEQRALCEASIDDAAGDRWMWPRDEARRLFIAGGGTRSEFDAGWAQRRAANDAVVRRIASKTYDRAGATVHYILAGRRLR